MSFVRLGASRLIANQTGRGLLASAGRRFLSDGGSQPTGFIGLGNMGGPMASNLLKDGQKLVVFDVVQEKLDAFRKEGADVVASPAEVAARAKRIVTMLPESQHVKEAYAGPNGIFSSLQKGSVFIDSSTIDPAVSVNMAKMAMEKGAMYMDAPVSGGVGAAKDGKLTFMVGGDALLFPDVKEFLMKMGKNVVHCGAVGTGLAAKIANNMLLAISMIGTSEAMNLGIRLGLDPKLLASIFNTSSGRCWSSDTYNPCPGVIESAPSNRNYEGGFGTALMAKDLRLAQSAAKATSADTPLGSVALQTYEQLCKDGYAKKDFSVIFQHLQKM